MYLGQSVQITWDIKYNTSKVEYLSTNNEINKLIIIEKRKKKTQKDDHKNNPNCILAKYTRFDIIGISNQNDKVESEIVPKMYYLLFTKKAGLGH